MFQGKNSPPDTAYEEPTHQTPDEASAALRAFLDGFAANPWFTEENFSGKIMKPRAVLIEASTGLGKSREGRLMISGYLRKNPGQTIVMFVPTHRLGKEQVDEFTGLGQGLVARRFLGTTQENPDSPDERMCLRSDIVASLCSNGISMRDLCAKPNLGLYCPHHVDNPEVVSVCGYSLQSKHRPDVWLIPHQLLFHKPPRCVGTVGLIVIDESFWQSALSHSRMTLSALEYERKDTSGAKSAGLAHKTTILGRAAAAAIRTMPDGFIDTRQIFGAMDGAWAARGYGKEIENFQDICIQGEWAAFSRSVRPDMSVEALEKTAESLQRQSVIDLNHFWHLLDSSDPGPTPFLVKNTAETKEGPVLYIDLYWVERLKNGWRLPTVLLDATPCKKITETFFPQSSYGQLELEKFTCPMTHTTITQVIDSKLPKAMMVPTDQAGGRKNLERKNNLARLAALVEVLANRGATLLVTSKAIEERIKGRLPDAVDVLHYGALSGLDEFRDHRVIILAGRLELPVRECEHQAGVFQKTAVEPAPGDWYDTKVVGIETTNKGLDIRVEATRHSNRIGEEIRWSWNEGQLLQALGRGRGVRRTVSNPLEIFICTNVPLPIQVDQVIKWCDLAPSKIEQDIARLGCSPMAYGEMVRVNPDRYKDRNAARYAVKKFNKRYADQPNQPAASSPSKSPDQSDESFGGENAY